MSKDDADIFFEIYKFINDANLQKFSDLVKVATENNYDDWLEFILKHDSLICKYMESRIARC